jgi:hypothetical protein
MRGEIATRPIVWVAMTIAATVALVVAAVFLLLRLWQTPPGADRVPLPYELAIPGPQLESAPQLDLQAYRQDKQRRMDSADWAGAQRGIARIPVADAMALLAASAAQRSPP